MKLEHCMICDYIHNTAHHCSACGAYHIIVNGKHYFCNAAGIPLARGIPLIVHRIIARSFEESE